MNIQFAEGYKNPEPGGPNSEDAVGAGARERKDIWSRGSREGVGAGGAELGRWSRSRGPREEGCNKAAEYEHEEEEGLKRT